jgi:lipoate---protein ligase
LHIKLLQLKNFDIFKQLQIEEAILRNNSSSENYCIINMGSRKSIVLGISSNADKHIENFDKGIPIIRRFSGGGSVVVDENTIFISFIISKKFLNFSYPEHIYSWLNNFYKKIFTIDGFSLKENDFVIFDKKFGGNAQYIKKDRWLHHTSFLWDFKNSNMDLLKSPPKIPKYRKNRNHNEFLTKLKDHISTKEEFFKNFENELSLSFRNFSKISLDDVLPILEKDHRKSTVLL